ncbi:hypothetical protein DFQ28_001186 [Apophysomyces sp. BC1034]|nr:hypothetical protein DFQ30_001909 [Apophysomyces sp. BC1015]KAG0166693.1 hypothetical protein DFQ29_000881 [Apophysomyces sp. BC1021]KAG0183709.1 hypothetical protein DFQ28_001186 [Apophysomyces sp. BC1034]
MNAIFRLTPRLTNKATQGLATRMYTTEVEAPKKVGAVRGGMLGFLLGVTLAGSAGYYYLLEEYNSASGSLLSSVEELQSSTDKIRDYARRIEVVDKDVAKLKDSVATAQQLNELKAEFRKLYDTLNVEHLELKTHVWGLGKG